MKILAREELKIYAIYKGKLKTRRRQKIPPILRRQALTFLSVKRPIIKRLQFVKKVLKIERMRL